MKTQRGSRSTALFFLSFGVRWVWVVNAMPWLLYTQEIHLVPIWLEAGWAPGLVCRKFCPPPGFNPWTFQPTASRYTDFAITVHRTGDVTLKYYFKESAIEVWCAFKLHCFLHSMSWNMVTIFTHFLAHSKDSYKMWLLACSYLSILACLPTWKSVTLTGEIFMQFNMWDFYKSLSTIQCGLRLDKNCWSLTQNPNYIYIISVYLVFISKTVCCVRY